MAELRGFDVLQKELERTRDDLKDVDDNIKKLTGHDPDNRRPPGVQRRVSLTEDGRDRIFKAARGGLADESPGRRMSGPRQPGRRVLVEEESPSPAKRRPPGGAFSRLGPRVGIANRLGRQNPSSVRQRPDSGDEDDADNKPAIQSSVVVTSTDSKTREEALEQQGKDEKGKARNRRMFGALLGTLQRFKVEETQHETQGKQRKEVERKLEVKARQEKDDLRKEKQTLFQERRNKQFQLKKLQQKIELVGIHEEWVAQTTTLMNFIRTKTKPYVFYLPKGHTEKSKKKLSQSKQVLKDIITERKKGLEEEILELAPGDVGEHEDEEEAKDELEPKEQHEEGDKDDHRDNDDDKARDLRRKEKRERRRESRNSDHSKSPKKSLVSPLKDGATPREQRRKRERRRESKEVHKKSTQNLEDKYKDEDGENWASGGEGEVRVTEDGMVVTEDVDEPVDHMETEETKKDHDKMDDDEKEDMDQEGEEEDDEKAADERDGMDENKEPEIGIQERLRTPPPPPLPPNVPYEPPLIVTEEVKMEFNEEQALVYEANENQEESTEVKSSEEPKHIVEEDPTEENVADIEVPPSPPPPPPPPPPPQPPSQKHHSTKKKLSPKKAKHDARRNKTKNSKKKKTADIKQKKKKKQQQQRSKKYKKRSRSASSSSSSSSSSSDSSRSGSSSSSSDSSSSSSSSSNSSSSGSESD